MAPPNWGKVHGSLDLIEAARKRGLDVAADQYPYVATATGLSANLPNWAHDGGDERLLERLQNPAVAGRLKAETSRTVEGGYADPAQGWKDIVVSSVKSEANQWVQGMNVFDVSERWGIAPYEALIRLLLEEKCRVSMVHFTLSEDDVEDRDEGAIRDGWIRCHRKGAYWTVGGRKTSRREHLERCPGYWPVTFGKRVS